MVTGVVSSSVGVHVGLLPRGVPALLAAGRPDPVARSQRVDRPDIEEYYRVRFSEVSLGAPSPPASGRRGPIESYLEIAAL